MLATYRYVFLINQTYGCPVGKTPIEKPLTVSCAKSYTMHISPQFEQQKFQRQMSTNLVVVFVQRKVVIGVASVTGRRFAAAVPNVHDVSVSIP